MRREVSLPVTVVVLIVLSSGCTLRTHKQGNVTNVSPEVREKVKLDNCQAYIDGRKVIVTGEVISDLPGTKSLKVVIEGRALKDGMTPRGDEYLTDWSQNILVPGHGNRYGFGHNISMSDVWKLPGIDNVKASITLFVEYAEGGFAPFANWSTTIPLVYLDPDRCSVGTGFIEGVQREFVLHAVFVNHQGIGSQIVEYERFIEYELVDGTTDSRSEVLTETIPPSRLGGTLGFRPTYIPWPIDLPAPRDSIARLVAGVRSGGAEWTETIIDRSQPGPSVEIYVDTTRCRAVA
jgi:hypothetical protein